MTTRSNYIVYESPDRSPDRLAPAPTASIVANVSEGKADFWVMSKDEFRPRDGGHVVLTPDGGGELPAALKEILRHLGALHGLADLDDDSVWVQMRTYGSYFYDRFLTPEIRQIAAAWPQGSVIVLAQNEDWVPWELVHDGDDFWGAKYILARTPKVPRAADMIKPEEKGPPRLHAGKVVHVIGGMLGDDFSTAQARLLFSALGEGVEIRRCEAEGIGPVLKAMAQADIVHFTCHGYPNPPSLQVGLSMPGQAGYGVECLSVLNVRMLNGLEHSIVFANACMSAEADAFLGESRSFAWAFYARGVDAYIGTLGLVPTQDAIAFAKEFYSFLFGGATVGEALLKTRQSMRQVPSPFWLFHCLYGNPYARKQLAGG